jgi:hypothetical protein
MTADNVPAAVTVAASADGEPLPHAWFDFELPMRRKNTYRMPIGPAGDDGTLRVEGATLTGITKRINDLFPMDYVGLAAGWSGELVVRACNREDVARLRRGYDTWGGTGFYPPDFLDQLDRLDATLRTIPSDALLTLTVAVEPAGSCRATTHASHADGRAA